MVSHVLGVVGSPRKGGNTELLVKRCLNGAREERAKTRILLLGGMRIEGCVACKKCPPARRKLCIHDDDMNAAYEDLQWADAIVFGTPVYFGTISGLLKTFMDRTRPLYNLDNRLNGKIAAGISVGGGRFGGQELALETIRTFGLNHGMLIAGSTRPFENWEACGVAENRNEILNDKFGLNSAFGLGKRLARL